MVSCLQICLPVVCIPFGGWVGWVGKVGGWVGGVGGFRSRMVSVGEVWGSRKNDAHPWTKLSLTTHSPVMSVFPSLLRRVGRGKEVQPGAVGCGVVRVGMWVERKKEPEQTWVCVGACVALGKSKEATAKGSPGGDWVPSPLARA